MKRFKLLHYLCIFLGILFIDQILKVIGIPSSTNVNSGVINFFVIKNPGVMFGSFAETSPMIRIVFFSVFGFFLNILFILILYFLRNKELIKMKIGLSTMIAGISGNVIDKVRLGYVIDFIHLNISELNRYAFNVADIAIITGVVIITYSLFKDYDQIFNPGSNRKTFLIDRSYQLRLSGLFVFSLLLITITYTVYTYTFFKSYIPSDNLLNSNIYFHFFLGISVIMIVYTMIIAIFLVIYSHRSVGSIKALRRFVVEVQTNKEAVLKLREGDFHRELYSISDEIKKIVQN